MSKKQKDGSILRHVAYIPNDKAKVGKLLKLPEPWGDGWVVDFAGPVVQIDDVDKARENLKRFQWVLGE